MVVGNAADRLTPFFGGSTDAFQGFPNTLCWFDAADASKYIKDDTGRVVGFRPHANSVGQGTLKLNDPTSGAAKDMFQGSINGLPALLGNSANYLLANIPFGPLTQFSACAVIQGGVENGLVFKLVGTNQIHLSENGITFNGDELVHGLELSLIDGNAHVVFWQYSATLDKARLLTGDNSSSTFNGVAAPGSVTYPTAMWFMGTTGPSPTPSPPSPTPAPPSPTPAPFQNWEGHVGEFMLSNDYWTDAQIVEVGNYLCQKWGVSFAHTIAPPSPSPSPTPSP